MVGIYFNRLQIEIERLLEQFLRFLDFREIDKRMKLAGVRIRNALGEL